MIDTRSNVGKFVFCCSAKLKMSLFEFIPVVKARSGTFLVDYLKRFGIPPDC